VNAWCDVFSRFVAVGTLSVLVFSAYRLCVLMCAVCYWLIGNVLLMYSGVVSLRLHLPCFGVAGWGGIRVPHGYHPNQPHRNSNTHRNKNSQPMW